MLHTVGRGRYARHRSSPINLRIPLIVAAVGLLEFAAALVAARSPLMALFITCAAIALAACFVWPAAIVTFMFAATFAVWRLGPAAVDMSTADYFGVLGAVAALPFVPWRSATFRRILFAMAGYCAVVSISVVANPSKAAGVDILHRFVLVMGAVCIGSAVARLGHISAALRLMCGTAFVLSIDAIFLAVIHGFAPSYPFGLQKNSAGELIAVTFVVVLLVPKRLHLPRTVVLALGGTLLLGLASTQSRGAGLALVAVFSIYALRNGWHGRGRRLVKLAPLFLVVSVAVLFFANTSLQDQSKANSGTSERFTSVGSRTNTYDIALHEVIYKKPLFGAGPKWFAKPGTPTGEPHNILIDELSTTGVFGTIALLVMLWVVFTMLSRMRSDLGDLAWYILITRVLATLVDLFWVAGPGTVPFLIIGLAIGTSAHDGSLEFEPNALETA